ncbi:hypothetical protein EGR_03287 [Echinococcus granulosus]|uniref:Uncharacterized protein n=1 Tax=Echinococcus granulosus TaxID=6210 RepID=W6UKQ2_ECHGR|nr:hypothetical protein EGR_03287 [Echinococcus granulosus]EUB61741.1 hypothetical protein EGR_03287 [Echinococcus granulosus]
MARSLASNTLLKSGPQLIISCKLKLEMLILSKYPTQLQNVHKYYKANNTSALGKFLKLLFKQKQSNAEGSAFMESKLVPKMYSRQANCIQCARCRIGSSSSTILGINAHPIWFAFQRNLLDKSTDRVTTNANDMNLHMKEIHRSSITPTLRLAGTL